MMHKVHFGQLATIWILVLLWLGNGPRPAWAQAGLRESLERLDRDEDGRIDPDEITPLARPYLERIARERRMSLDRSNDISDFQEAARIYYARQNGIDDDRVRARSDSSFKSLEPDDEDVLVPDFGLAEVKYPYTRDDLEEAQRTIWRYDRDDDGFIDRREARRSRWTHRDPFEMDLNKDDRLSLMELTQRYARRRMLDNASDELVQKARRVGNGIESSRRRDDRDDRSRWWSRRQGSSYWLSSSLISRFDDNRNGRLEIGEVQAMGIPIGMIDIDRDGEVTRDELQEYTSTLQEEVGDPGEGLPGWFYELDANRDGQVAMPEFASEWTSAKIAEFKALDVNGDGLLTSKEVLSSKAMVGGSFSSNAAEVLPPRKTIISEIEVPEDLFVGDLELQVSITHTSVDMLDGYLTGPNGERIELFTEVGGSGNHFEDTVFDDEADRPINKARAPFEGSYMPEAVVKREPGLSQFKGKNAKGVWQLVIRGTRSDRFGMLNGWTLRFRAEDDMVGEAFLTSSQDGSSQTPSSKDKTNSNNDGAAGDS